MYFTVVYFMEVKIESYTGLWRNDSAKDIQFLRRMIGRPRLSDTVGMKIQAAR